MSFVAIVLLIAVSSIAHIQGACPAGWEAHSSCCYLFSKDKASFSETSTKCSAKGGALADIGGKDEGEWVQGRAKQLGLNKVWLAVSDEMKKSTFKKIANGIEKTHCISWTPNNEKWQDGSCDAKYSFVCKKC